MSPYLNRYNFQLPRVKKLSKEIKITENGKETKRLATENSKRAMELLSEYTNCMSNFMPLQNEQPFWLTSNHKSTNCTSQLCANSNFYDSYMKINNFELADTYGSSQINKSNGNKQVAHAIIANVTHLIVELTQNSLNELLPKETDLLELSVNCSSLPAEDGIVTEKAPAKGKGDKSSESLCAGHINEKMTKNTVKFKNYIRCLDCKYYF